MDASQTDATGANESDPSRLDADSDALPLFEEGRGFTPVEPQEQPVSMETAEADAAGEVSGFDAQESVELPQRRGHGSKEFRNPDGTHTTRVYTEPVHYRDPSGTWKEIDTSLVPAEQSASAQSRADQGVSGDRLSTAADDSGLTVASTGDDPDLATLNVGDEDQQVSFSLAHAEGVEAEVNDGIAHFSDIRTEADLKLQAEHGMLKETIVLNSPDAPRTWTFPLDPGGLTPEMGEDGSVVLTDADGTVQAVVPAGWMEDSSENPESGGPAVSGGVTYRLEEQDGQWLLKIELDDDWLSASERVYPVKVDPSVADIETYGDAFVQDDWPNQNFGGDDELKVGSYDAGGSRAMSFLRFDNVTSRLKDRYILNADLGLFNVWSSSCADHEVRVHRVKQAWKAKNITWNNRPSTASTPVGAASFASGENCGGSDWHVIDLGRKGVNLVQGWVDGSTDNYGLSIKADFGTSGPWKRFGSRNSANEPYMAITHSAWGASYEVDSQTAPLTGNQSGEVPVKVTNLGDLTWEPQGWNEFRLGARVRDHDSGKLLDAVAFTRLTERLTPGDTATLQARIPPLPPGEYKINFDMQRLKDQTWLSEKNVPVTTVSVTSQDVGPRITDIYPHAGGQAGSLTPALFAATESIDDWPADADMDQWFELCRGTAEEPVDCIDSGWVDNRTWTVPEGTLDWGQQYVWRVRGREADTEGPLSPYYSFVTAVEQPAITSELGAGGMDGSERGVSPRIGNYTTTDTDADVAAVGPALSVARTYNSRDPRTDNTFGAGWSTRYDMGVAPDGDGTGNVVVTYPDGRQVRFGKNPDGTYAPPYGSFATLTTTDGGGWRLTDKDQTDYTFNAQGRLTGVADFRGRNQELAYNDQGRLTTVTAAGDRSLHMSWSNGHVTTVTTDPPDADTNPLSWNYTYNGDRLTHVCGPEDTGDACTRYTYADGSHHRTTVRDAGPFSYWRFSEEQGAQTADSDLLLDRADHAGTYHDVQLGTAGALAGSPDTAATFNGDSSYVQLPDQLVSDTPYLSIELWFRTGGDGVLFGYQDNTLEEATTGEYTPALYVGTDGRLRGEFWNGSAEPIASDQSVDDGTWHHAALTAAGNTQTLYLDGDPVGSLDGSIVQHDQHFVYLGAGYWKDWPSTSGEAGHFEGDIDEAAVYTRPLGPRTLAEHHASAATAQQLTKVTQPSGRIVTEVSYDTVRDRVSSYTDAHGGTYRLSPHRLTGTRGRPAGDDQEAVPEDPTVTVTITDPDERTSSYTYDPLQGHRLLSQKDVGGNEASYAYDTGGFLAGTTAPDGTVTRLGHDKRGNKISQTTCRDTDNEATCHTSHYAYYLNPDDPLDPRNDQLTAESDGRSAGANDGTYRTTHSYNDSGDRVSTTTPATADFPEGRTVKHTYTDGTEDAIGAGTVPAGLLATTTSARGGVTTRDYFATGDLARTTDPAGLVTEYTYDALGRETSSTVISEAHPDGVTTTTGYDGESRVVTTTGPVTTDSITGEEHRSSTEHTYDADGNLLTTAVSDTVGDDATRTTERTYDTHGRLSGLTDPEQRTETYTYDVYGHQTSRTMPGGTTFRYAYTPRGDLAEVVLADWQGGSEPADVVLDSYAYDPAGRLAEHTDAMGRTTRYTYYDDGLRAQEIRVGFHDPDGSTRDIVLSDRSYDAAGNLVRETTGNGAVTTDYEIDAAGHTTASVLDPGGLARRTEYTYDAGGSVIDETRSGSGGTRTEHTTYTRNDAGDITRVAVANGDTDLVTTRVVDDRGLVVSETSPRGNTDGADPANHTTDYRYDALGRRTETLAPPVSVQPPQSQASTERPTTRTGYNTFGEKTSTQNPNGHITRTTYDGLGRAVETTLPDYTPPGADTPLQATRTRTYNAAGHLASETDPLGNTTSYTYDQLGNLTKKTEPAPQDGAQAPVTTYTYDLLGELLSQTDPTGARTEYTYDDLGRPVTSTDIERHSAPGSYTTRLAYDDSGNVVSTTTPSGAETTRSYNTAGQLTAETTPADATTSHSYGPTGLPTAVTDPVGTVTRNSYDPAGRTTGITVEDADGTQLQSRSVQYDAEGNPTHVTDPLDHTVRQSFDAMGRMTELVEPVDTDETITTRFGYDAAGNRTRLTDGRGNTTWYTFTSHGAIESIIEPATDAHPDPAERTWSTVYDAAGRQVEERLPGGVTQQRTYDALGRITQESGSGAEADTAPTSLGYDAAGHLTSVNAPGGTNTYTWDDRGNLLTTAGPSGTAEFQYNADGQMTQRTDAAGTATFSHDAAGRLQSATDPLTGTTRAYGYDNASRLTSIAYGDSAAQRNLNYDAQGRLTSDILNAPDGTGVSGISYAYDAADRLVGKTTAGTAGAGEHTYDYDHAGRLTSWTAPDGTVTDYGWDAAGNRTSAGDAAASYDARNRVLSADGTTYTWSARGTLASATTGEDTRTSSYDALGRLVDDGDTSYTYDGLGRLVQRGNTNLAYSGISNSPVSAGGQLFSRGPDGAPLASAAADGSSAASLLTNAHDDVVGSFDPASGELSGSSAYSPFGEVTATEGTESALGYQGGYTDPDSGRVNMHARWYDPSLGGFSSRDSWTLNPTPSVQANRYTYGNASPLLNTDHSGHFLDYKEMLDDSKKLLNDGVGWAKNHADDIGRWGRRAWKAKNYLNPVGVFWEALSYAEPLGYYKCELPSTPDCHIPPKPPRTGSFSSPTATVNPHWAPSGSSGGRHWGGYGGSSWGGYGTVVATQASPPPPPPPPPWRKMIQTVLAEEQARPASEATVDTEHEEFVEDSYTRVRDELELPAEQLRKHFKMHPSGQSNEVALREFERLVDEWENQDKYCLNNNKSWSYYLPRDEHGRATGAVACLQKDEFDVGGRGVNPQNLNTEILGSDTNRKGKANPPGYAAGHDMARGHLLGRQLGGSGKDLRNLVPQYNHPNSVGQRKFENCIANRVESGERIYYLATPRYRGDDLVPYQITLHAVGIRRTDESAVVYNSPEGDVDHSCK
ncbi:DNRLRE domain-containing protein [Streptomonospora algeriensis]|uniref:DNRLRE domain-containing protein n=1 Tax=Streptomonospora algeriensis TaxID=995084 RepID=A0ABW3B9B8_9ACTN